MVLDVIIILEMPCIFAYKGFKKKNLKSNLKMQGGISREKENIKKTQAT